MGTPSELLQGEIISGWLVEEPIQTFQGKTGGSFSKGYIVSKNNKKAFLKAMDLAGAMLQGIDSVALTTRQYQFERDLMRLCKDRGLSHIVRMLDEGEFVPSRLPIGSNPAFSRVYYLIFELADGDIRRELHFEPTKPNSWKIYVLHEIAVALSQLHSTGISHQDLKPSNVLSFSKEHQEKNYKLTDLGRSASISIRAPTDSLGFPGDLGYAPPEYYYGHIPSDYHNRRIGSDAFYWEV